MAFDQLYSNPLFNMEVGSTLPISYNFDHPDYTRKSEVWKTCRDAVEGQEAIKAEKTRYLPKLNGQSAEEYENYLNRALYYNATGRTVQSYNGMIFRKDPIIKVFNKDGSEATDFNKKDYFKSVTNKGKSLTDLLHDVVDEVIQVNRVGILVDYPNEEDLSFGSVSRMTKLDKERLGWKPMLTKYSAESIVNWQYMYVGTTPVPVMYVVKEEVWDYAESIFPSKTDIYRIMALEPYTEYEGGPTKVRYKQITFKDSVVSVSGKPDENVWQITDIVYPKKDGKFMNFIPFYILTDRGIDFENLDNPMIYDLAVLNISHYMNSADLENELHLISIKTIVFPGWSKDAGLGDPRIGGALAVPKDCMPQVLEASNKSGLADQLGDKEDRMAVLGSSAIDRGGRYVASSQTARISSRAESSILTTMAVSLSTAFEEILTFLLEWDDKPEYVVEVALNTDYYNDDMTATHLEALTKSLQQGSISFDSYYYQLEQKEFFPPNWSKDKELESIRETLAPYFDLSEERFLEVSSRIDVLENITGEASVGATAAFIAPIVSGDAEPSATEISDNTREPVIVPEENVENN